MAADNEVVKSIQDVVFEGDINALRQCWQGNREQFKSVDNNGSTLMHFAAAHGHTEVLEFLLNTCGMGPDVQDNHGNTPLHSAAGSGQLSAVQLLIKNQVVKENLDAKTRANDEAKDGGNTPLHLAAMGGYHEVMTCLIKSGADIHRGDAKGMTALHWAACCGHLEATKLLVKMGALWDARDTLGCIPLDYARTCQHIEVENYFNDLLKTKLVQAVLAGDETEIQALLVQGAVVDIGTLAHCVAVNPLVSQPLIEGKRLSILTLLLAKAKVDINIAVNDKGETLLHLAAMNGFKEIIECLLENKADVRAVDKRGFTAVHGAAIVGRSDMIALLAEKGADLNAKGENGFSPLHVAVRHNQGNSVTSLARNPAVEINIQAAAGLTPLHIAAINGYKAVAKILLEKGADMHARDNQGLAPIALAESMGQTYVGDYLLKYQRKHALAISASPVSSLNPCRYFSAPSREQANALLLFGLLASVFLSFTYWLHSKEEKDSSRSTPALATCVVLLATLAWRLYQTPGPSIPSPTPRSGPGLK